MRHELISRTERFKVPEVPMDEVRTIRRRTHVWPVVIAAVILALVIAFVLLMNDGAPSNNFGWNGVVQWQAAAAQGGEYGFA